MGISQHGASLAFQLPCSIWPGLYWAVTSTLNTQQKHVRAHSNFKMTLDSSPDHHMTTYR